MEYNVRDDAMRLVVYYLNDDDVKNASLTCRSWKTIIDEETNIKGPKLVTQEIIINRHNMAVAKNEHVFVSTDMKPLLLLCITNKNCNSVIAKRHMSYLNPDDCILVELKRDVFEDVNTVGTILFRSSPLIKVNTLYFVTKCKVPGSELRWLDLPLVGRKYYDPRYFRQLHELSDWFETVTFNQTFNNFILVLFCTYSDIPELIEIIEHLTTWQSFDGHIWGCTINSAQVVRNTVYKGPESFQVNCIQIYITGEHLTNKILILNEHCNTKEKIRKKFQDLKCVARLKKYSIAFMCTSVARYNEFYKIEAAAFREIFPEVQLAHIFSSRPFLAENLVEFHTYLKNIRPHETINVTTVLLFPYID